MNDIILIKDATINNEIVQTVDARELHEFLESKQEFANWIKQRIKQYDFVKDLDYIIVIDKTINNPKGGPSFRDYGIKLSMAKELSMVERNPKGKEARKYFIQCEEELKTIKTETQPMSIAVQHLATIQALAHQAQITVNQQEQLDNQQEQLNNVTKRQNSMDGSNGYMTVRGFDRVYEANLSTSESILLGRMCSKICKNKKVEIRRIYDERHGSVGSYPIQVLEDALHKIL